MVPNAFMFITRRILWIITPNTLSCTSVLLGTFLPSGVGPKGALLECLNALNSKTDRNKLTYRISESSISFLDLFLYRDTSCCNFPPFKSLLTSICIFSWYEGIWCLLISCVTSRIHTLKACPL